MISDPYLFNILYILYMAAKPYALKNLSELLFLEKRVISSDVMNMLKNAFFVMVLITAILVIGKLFCK